MRGLWNYATIALFSAAFLLLISANSLAGTCMGVCQNQLCGAAGTSIGTCNGWMDGGYNCCWGGFGGGGGGGIGTGNACTNKGGACQFGACNSGYQQTLDACSYGSEKCCVYTGTSSCGGSGTCRSGATGCNPGESQSSDYCAGGVCCIPGGIGSCNGTCRNSQAGCAIYNESPDLTQTCYRSGEACCVKNPSYTCNTAFGETCEIFAPNGYVPVSGKTCPTGKTCYRQSDCLKIPTQYCGFSCGTDIIVDAAAGARGDCSLGEICCLRSSTQPPVTPTNTAPTCTLNAAQDKTDPKKFTFTATASDKEDNAVRTPITSGSIQYGDSGADGKPTPAESVASLSTGKAHTYTSSAATNSYTATLTVTDKKGATGTCTKTVSYNVTATTVTPTCDIANCKTSCSAAEEEDKTKTCAGGKLCCVPRPPAITACETGDRCRSSCIAPEFDTVKATKTCNDAAGGKVCCTPNGPPEAPKIEGPQTGRVNAKLSYKFTSNDPDLDRIRYGVDWTLDGVADEWLPSPTGLVNSGISQTAAPHTWAGIGVKKFQALAQDSRLNRSGWSEYSVDITDDACDNPAATCIPSCSAAGKIKDNAATGSDPLCTQNGVAAECCLNPAAIACTSGIPTTTCKSSCGADEQQDWLQGTCNDNAGATMCCVKKPDVSISAAPASISESGPVSAITLSCANQSHGQISIAYQASGSAQNGADYSLDPAGNTVPITCPASVQIKLTPTNNDVVGPASKRATFTIQSNTAYTISKPEDTVTINDDDKYTCVPSGGTCENSPPGCSASQNPNPTKTCPPNRVCCLAKPPTTTQADVCDPGDMCRIDCILPEVRSSTLGHKEFCNDTSGARTCCSPGAGKIQDDLVSIEITTEKKAYRSGDTINPLITVRRLERKTNAEPLVERIEFKTARILPSSPAIAMPDDSVVFKSLVSGLNGAIDCTDPKALIKICGRRVDNPGKFGINAPGTGLAPGNYTLTATITEIYDDSSKALSDPVTFNNTAGTFVQVYDNPTAVPEIPPIAGLVLAVMVILAARIRTGKGD